MIKKEITLKRKICNAVLEDIIKGEYPSDFIINEKYLIEKYEVSKSPVRDALIVLCNEGILKSIPRYGYQIVKMTPKDINELIEYRLMLESQCIKKIIENATPDDLKSIEQYLAKCKDESCEADIIEHWNNNIQFHLTLNKYANNQYIYAQLEKSMSVLTRAYAQLHWDKWHKTDFIIRNGCHINILEQILKRDFEKAYEELKHDASYFNEFY